MNPHSRVFMATVLLLSHISIGGMAWGLGFLQGGAQVDRARTAEERELLGPLLAADPAFKDVTLEKNSAGGVYLSGSVSTAADSDRLRALVVKQIGEAWLQWRYGVGAPAKPKP